MSDVLLAEAPVKNPIIDRHPWASPPLILAYIASVLMKEDYQVSAVDFNVGSVSGLNLDRVKRIVEVEKPKILGISAWVEPYLNALRIARIAKEVNPDIYVVMLGPQPSVIYEETIREPDVDFIVMGEGEFAMLELTNYLLRNEGELSGIRNIVYSKDDEILVTPERPPLENVDKIPYPARALFPLEFYPYPGAVRTAWGGCPANCRFCNVPIYRGKGYVPRKAEDIVEEILYLLKAYPFVDVIKLVDDTFFLEKNHLLHFTELLKNLDAPREWSWTCTTRVNLVDREMLEAAYSSGCSTILVGAESGSQGILDSMEKGITPERVRNVVKMAKEVGLRINVTFMFPFPEDTRETIRQTKEFMIELKEMGANLIVAHTTPYPGTYLYEHADELGIKILADSWEDFDAKHLIITTKYLGKEELEELFEEIVRDVGFVNVASLS